MQEKHEDLKIIDAHAHIFPPKIVRKASESIGEFYGVSMSHTGDAASLLASGAKIGVSRYLVCSSATVPAQVGSINDFIASECALHPEFTGFGTLHPAMADPRAEAARIASLGLRGVKLHPDFQGFAIDDPDAVRLYRAAAAEGLPVLFHTGDRRYGASSPPRLAAALEAVGDLRAIAAHFGGYSEWEKVRVYPPSPRLRFDTSSSLFELPAGEARDLIAHFGADKFYFGVDFPMWDHAEELERFLALGLGARERDMILHSNFERDFRYDGGAGWPQDMSTSSLK